MQRPACPGPATQGRHLRRPAGRAHRRPGSQSPDVRGNPAPEGRGDRGSVPGRRRPADRGPVQPGRRRRAADPRGDLAADPSPEAGGGQSPLHARPAAHGDRRRQAVTPALPLAITMGEPAGIGGELSLKAWLARKPSDRPFLVLDDAARLAALARDLRLDVPLREISRAADAAAVFATALPVLPVRLRAPATPGRPDPVNAPATLEAIERGAALALAGDIAGVVTNPIQKKTLQEAGFRHPGHTEYLAEFASVATGKRVEVAMMLACPGLRVVPVTIHLALAEAVRALDADTIARVGRIAAAGLTALFGIARPRLVVAGPNPHAGERGGMGDEERRVSPPA